VDYRRGNVATPPDGSRDAVPAGIEGVAPSPAAPPRVRGLRRLLAATAIAVPAFSRHRGSQLAAAISYRVLFAIVPFLALALSLLDLVLGPEQEADIDDWLAGLAPGDDALEASLASALSSTGTVASITGLVALAGLLWTSSGMAASMRSALGVVWEHDQRPPFLRGKLVDLVLVFVGVGVLLTAFVASLAVQLVTTFGTEIAEALDLERVDVTVLGTIGQSLATLLVTIVALLVLYRVASGTRSVRELLPGAIVGGVGIHLAILGFSLYVDLVAGFDEIYGALGGIFAFLFLVYLVASALVIGAEVVAAWALAAQPKVPSGHEQPLGRRLLDVARSLVAPSRNA
jgi:membrane protein